MKMLFVARLAGWLLLLSAPFAVIAAVFADDCDGTYPSTAVQCMDPNPCSDGYTGANCSDYPATYNPRLYSLERYTSTNDTRAEEYNNKDCLEQWRCKKKPGESTQCEKDEQVLDINGDPVFTQIAKVYANVSCVGKE